MSNQETIEIAMLPLADGRKVVIPLVALAEVRQVQVSDESGDAFASIKWRGLELEVESLDAFCGLPRPALEKHNTVGIFRGGKDSGVPFRALAFCGIASHRRIEPYEIESIDTPVEGRFTAAGEMDGETCLVPDLPGMMYTVRPEATH